MEGKRARTEEGEIPGEWIKLNDKVHLVHTRTMVKYHQMMRRHHELVEKIVNIEDEEEDEEWDQSITLIRNNKLELLYILQEVQKDVRMAREALRMFDEDVSTLVDRVVLLTQDKMTQF